MSLGAWCGEEEWLAIEQAGFCKAFYRMLFTVWSVEGLVAGGLAKIEFSATWSVSIRRWVYGMMSRPMHIHLQEVRILLCNSFTDVPGREYSKPFQSVILQACHRLLVVKLPT